MNRNHPCCVSPAIRRVRASSGSATDVIKASSHHPPVVHQGPYPRCVLVSIAGPAADGELAVTLRASVTNTGRRAGTEVVQVYVGDTEASVARPLRELKGFVKVQLEPGETQQVSCLFDERTFAFWSTRFQQWVVESGEFMIAVGSSSRDLVATEMITLDAPRQSLPLKPYSTLDQWLEDDLAVSCSL